MTQLERIGSYRFPALDLFRFFAALVVFLGHLVFFSDYGNGFKDHNWIQPIRTGTFAVDFFFALSGFVLSAKKPTLRWISSRVMRLYPVYFVGLSLGAFVNITLAGSLDTDFLGLFFAVFGLQALSTKYQLVLNAPLWSLSVEMIMTPFFIIFFWMKKGKVFLSMGFISSIVIATSYENSVVLRSLPFFILGTILSSLKRPRPGKIFNRILVLFVVVYLVIGSHIFSHTSYTFFDLILKLTSLALLIYCLLGVQLGSNSAKISSELGKRSYALYAVHGPLIGISLSAWKPSEFLPFLGYVVTTVILSIVCSEFVYKLVDLPAIQKALSFQRQKS